MRKSKEWFGKGKRGLAIALIALMSLSGVTAYADEVILSEDEEEHCYVKAVLGAGEEWEYTNETIRLPDGYVGEVYENGNHRLKCESCGLRPEVWRIDEGMEDYKLPDGMDLRENGTLVGTPQEEGEYMFIVTLEAGDEESSPSDAHVSSWTSAGAAYVITIQPKRTNNNNGNNNSNSNDRDSSGSDSGSSNTYSRKQGWNLEGEDWYYYVRTSSGSLQLFKGWLLDPQDNFWYFLELETGKMYTGWHEIGGKEYYFNPESPFWTWEKVGDEWRYKGIDGSRPKGSMYCNEMTPDGHMVGEDGAKLP